MDLGEIKTKNLDVNITFYFRDLFKSKLNVSMVSFEKGLITFNLESEGKTKEKVSVFNELNKIFYPHNKIKIRQLQLLNTLLESSQQSAFVKELTILNQGQNYAVKSSIEDIDYRDKKSDQINADILIDKDGVNLNSFDVYLNQLKINLNDSIYNFKSEKGKFNGKVIGNISGVEMLLGKSKPEETIYGESNIDFTGSLDGENIQFKSGVKINSIFTKGMTPNNLDVDVKIENNILVISNLELESQNGNLKVLDPIEVDLKNDKQLKNNSLDIKLDRFLIDPKNWLVLKYVKAGPGGSFLEI